MMFFTKNMPAMNCSIRRNLHLLTLSLTVIVSACGPYHSVPGDSDLPAFTGKVSGDYQRLQGTWIVKGSELQGLALIPDAVFHFSGNQHWHDGDKDREWFFALDESSSPKAIDFYDKKSRVVRGIYKLEGNQLTLCTVAPGRPRPTEFSKYTSSSYTGSILTKARRK